MLSLFGSWWQLVNDLRGFILTRGLFHLIFPLSSWGGEWESSWLCVLRLANVNTPLVCQTMSQILYSTPYFEFWAFEFFFFFLLTFLVNIHHKIQIHSNSETSNSSFFPMMLLLWNSVPVNVRRGRISTRFSGSPGFKLACLEMNAKFGLTCRGLSEDDFFFFLWNCSKECFVTIQCDIQFVF